MTDRAPTHYDQHGFEFFERFIAPDAVNALLNMVAQVVGTTRETYRGIIRQSQLTDKIIYGLQGRDFVPLNTFHWGLTPVISRHVGQHVLPSYSSFRVYQQGDLLKVHSDRMASEHGMSLMLGSSDGHPWGLSVGHDFIEDPMNWKGTGKPTPNLDDFGDEPFSTYDLSPGDAVLYQGINRRHGRLKPNPNRWSAHLFMFWVNKDGPYAEHAFDGEKHPLAADYTF